MNKKPHELVEDYLRSVFPQQPTNAEIRIGMAKDAKWVSQYLFILKKMGLAQVTGRAQWARWRLTAGTYESIEVKGGKVDLEPDPNAKSYLVLAAMQETARTRLLQGVRL